MTDDKIEKNKNDGYRKNSFGESLRKFIKSILCPLLQKAFVLYYTLQNPRCPKWAKATIVGALAYLISFIDLIPDLMPVVGYTDDLAVLIAAIALVSMYITDVERMRAKEKVKELLNCED